jgi:queuine tRNA-ribosyltransferase
MKDLFSITSGDRKGGPRTGILRLPHGPVETPVFMPVGTQASVKAMTREWLEEIGFNLILANTYHLMLRPGPDVIARSGGLHGFSGWNGNFLTDSGGYQVFSLASSRKVREEGVEFRSHIDGSRRFVTPADVVELQTIFQSDIMMQLDFCTPWKSPRPDAERALRLSSKWAVESDAAWKARADRTPGLHFPIMQGNFFPDLRKRSAEDIIALDPPGIAIGGLSVGEPYEEFREFLALSSSLSPTEKPRYLMGIGTPEYILDAVEAGIDMFDCVFPTRTARNGLLFTRNGPLSIKKAAYEFDTGPVDASCACRVCAEYPRSYLRHLFRAGEILYSMLATYHNLFFIHSLIRDLKSSIMEGSFAAFKADFLASYSGGER